MSTCGWPTACTGKSRTRCCKLRNPARRSSGWDRLDALVVLEHIRLFAFATRFVTQRRCGWQSTKISGQKWTRNLPVALTARIRAKCRNKFPKWWQRQPLSQAILKESLGRRPGAMACLRCHRQKAKVYRHWPLPLPGRQAISPRPFGNFLRHLLYPVNSTRLFKKVERSGSAWVVHPHL